MVEILEICYIQYPLICVYNSSDLDLFYCIGLNVDIHIFHTVYREFKIIPTQCHTEFFKGNHLQCIVCHKNKIHVYNTYVIYYGIVILTTGIKLLKPV